MSDYMGDLSAIFGTGGVDYSNTALGKKDRSTLDLNDYLKLMVAMFQNQSMDNTADISDMMNNMVQMSVVQAISSISSLIEESTALNYAASLVGKQVTVGIVHNGQMVEIEGYVAATGTYNGQQVIFLKDKGGNPIEGYVPITSIMAVGWLSQTGAAGGTGEPEGPGDIEDPEDPGDIEDPGESGGSGEIGGNEETETPETPEVPEESGGAGATGQTGENEEPEIPEGTDRVEETAAAEQT